MHQTKKATQSKNGQNNGRSPDITQVARIKQSPAILPATYHNRTMFEKYIRHLIGSAHGSSAREVLDQVLPEHQAAMRRLMSGSEQLWKAFQEETKV